MHSKLYLWCQEETPQLAFLGSANYTQTGMCSSVRREILISCPATEARDYFQSLVGDSIYCTHGDVPEHLCMYADEKRKTGIQDAARAPVVDYSGLEHVVLTLLARGGDVGAISGLNWGQRAGRDPNQAYVGLPASVYRTDFFPPRTVHFTVLTDDAKTLICTRAQDSGKAIHTPHNNSLMGSYFRNRLGVADGAPVTLMDLQAYGRTDVDFYKIDAETYYLDFSV